MPIVQLAQRIVQRADRDALRELHENRPCFAYGPDKHLLMAPYLSRLKASNLARRWCGPDAMVVDRAYDLTLDKFMNLPAPGQGRAADGPDCRYYYRAFVSYVESEFRANPPASLIEAELRGYTLLQRFLTRHFGLSGQEWKRRALQLVRRYCWKVNGDRLPLWLPVEMTGSYCRTWLQENIPDVDPSRPGERDRVQAIVDRLLARRRILSLDRLCGQGECIHAGSVGVPSTLEEQTTVAGLASVVAEEKVEIINDQRPAIRAIGPDRLRELVRTVFEALVEDRYHAEQIATDFGLSKATFSRFAGCEWSRSTVMPDADSIPDLWQNTAHVLASHEDFVAVARGAGVWGRVCQVAGEAGHGKGDTE
jgi:hypothetical protein